VNYSIAVKSLNPSQHWLGAVKILGLQPSMNQKGMTNIPILTSLFPDFLSS